jgi:hypothetical protein
LSKKIEKISNGFNSSEDTKKKPKEEIVHLSIVLIDMPKVAILPQKKKNSRLIFQLQKYSSTFPLKRPKGKFQTGLVHLKSVKRNQQKN